MRIGKSDKKNRIWTHQDRIDLESGNFTMKEFAEMEGITVHAVRGFVYRSGIIMPNRKKHTPDEIKKVQRLYKHYTAREIAVMLNMPLSRVESVATKVGIVKKVSTTWTVEQEQFVLDNPQMSSYEIGKKLNKTYKAIQNRRVVLAKRAKG